jgi:outer membrane protein TolC
VASRPWEPPAGAAPPLFINPVAPDPEREYDLAALIDLALRANPETRVAWEQARAAAARLGLADSAYFPVLAVVAQGGYSRVEDRSESGPVYTTGPSMTSLLALQWTLFDFGRRQADFERAMAQLWQSSFSFNRQLQRVAYIVQQSFYAYDASRAQVEAAVATLKAATSVQEAAEARMAGGLATQTEVLLTRQERARAAYEVQAAQRGVADSYSRLAESVGISPAASLRVTTLSTLHLPSELRQSVEEAMDRALSRRPDLAARLALLRAREAEVDRARASFLPAVSFAGSFGGTGGQFEPQGVETRFDYAEPVYSALLQFSWTLFDGFARENAVREAEARRGEAQAQLTRLQLETLRQVWKSYADVRVALLQYDYAKALLDASSDAYEAAFESYNAGLADVLDLLAAERDLARARSTSIDSRAEVLRTAAALAFAVGDSEEALVRF